MKPAVKTARGEPPEARTQDGLEARLTGVVARLQAVAPVVCKLEHGTGKLLKVHHLPVPNVVVPILEEGLDEIQAVLLVVGIAAHLQPQQPIKLAVGPTGDAACTGAEA